MPKTLKPKPRSASPAKSSRFGDDTPQSLEADAVEVEITSLESFTPSKNIVIYGPSGVGKTVLAAGAPNVTFLSTEPGVVAAQRAHRYKGEKIGLIHTPTWPHVEAGLKLASETLGPDSWLVVDSASKMQRLMLRWILDMQHDRNAVRDLDIPAIQDHQKWQNMFMRFIGKVVDAEYNSILIATSMMREDEEGEDIVLPNITGKNFAISMDFCAEADMVLYYAVSKSASTRRHTVRRLLAQPFPPYVAKDRYNCLGKWYDVNEGDYSAMADIVERIEISGYDEDED